jgi:hypothetical protein
MTDTQLRVMLNDVQALRANRTRSPEMEERLLGVEQALLMILGKKNYVDMWIRNEATAIQQRHKEGCDCGACRIVVRYEI